MEKFEKLHSENNSTYLGTKKSTLNAFAPAPRQWLHRVPASFCIQNGGRGLNSPLLAILAPKFCAFIVVSVSLPWFFALDFHCFPHQRELTSHVNARHWSRLFTHCIIKMRGKLQSLLLKISLHDWIPQCPCDAGCSEWSVLTLDNAFGQLQLILVFDFFFLNEVVSICPSPTQSRKEEYVYYCEGFKIIKQRTYLLLYNWPPYVLNTFLNYWQNWRNLNYCYKEQIEHNGKLIDRLKRTRALCLHWHRISGGAAVWKQTCLSSNVVWQLKGLKNSQLYKHVDVREAA